MRHALVLAIAFAAAATAALAQTPQRRPEPWQNPGGVPPKDAAPRSYPGEHGVGDVIAEIDITPSRLGHLAADVSLGDGALTPAAHTPLRAYSMRYISYDAGAQWCTIANGANIICIAPIGPRLD